MATLDHVKDEARGVLSRRWWLTAILVVLLLLGVAARTIFEEAIRRWWWPPTSQATIEDPTPSREWRKSEVELLREKSKEGNGVHIKRDDGRDLHLQLGDIGEEDGKVVQRFTLDGRGLGSGPGPGSVGPDGKSRPFFEVRHRVGVRGGGHEYTFGSTQIGGSIALDKRSRIEICSEAWDVQIRVASVHAQYLVLEVWRKAGTWREGPPDKRCTWMDVA